MPELGVVESEIFSGIARFGAGVERFVGFGLGARVWRITAGGDYEITRSDDEGLGFAWRQQPVAGGR